MSTYTRFQETLVLCLYIIRKQGLSIKKGRIKGPGDMDRSIEEFIMEESDPDKNIYLYMLLNTDIQLTITEHL